MKDIETSMTGEEQEVKVLSKSGLQIGVGAAAEEEAGIGNLSGVEITERGRSLSLNEVIWNRPTLQLHSQHASPTSRSIPLVGRLYPAL